MTIHIDKVREALELYASDATWGKDDWGVLSVNVREYGMPGREAHTALSALQAHEAEVKELVEALRKLERFVTNSDDDFGLEQDWTEECRDVVMGARAILAKVKP